MKLSKIVKSVSLITCILNFIKKPLANPICPTGSNALVPIQLIGTKFTIELLDPKNAPLFSAAISLPSGSNQPAVTFETIGSCPNITSSNPYAEIIYKDACGIIQYQQSCTGDKKLTSQKQTFNLTGSGQEKISIFHQEPNRCLLNNKSQNKAITCSNEQDKIVNTTYQLINNLIPEELIILDPNEKNFSDTTINRSDHDKSSITSESKSNILNKDSSIENQQNGKMINPYPVKEGSYFPGNYNLVQVPLPQSITTSTSTMSTTPISTSTSKMSTTSTSKMSKTLTSPSTMSTTSTSKMSKILTSTSTMSTTPTTMTTSTPTTSTPTPYSTIPLTTAMASTPLSPNTSVASSSHPAALVSLLVTGMLLIQ